MIRNNICNNCGKQGHMFHQCKLPITSYGIILFRYNNNQIEYLMIRRKDSFGYIDLLRGKYVLTNIEQIQNIFNEMSLEEKQRIKENDFVTLWKNMWGETVLNSQYKNEELSSYIILIILLRIQLHLGKKLNGKYQKVDEIIWKKIFIVL
jgi:hypothetical protein